MSFEKALLTAIYSALINSTAGTLTSNRIYYDRGPDGVQFPFIVYSLIQTAPEDPFAGTLERSSIQVSLFSMSHSVGEIIDLYNAVQNALDDKQLTLSQGEMVIIQRENVTGTVEETDSGEVKHWVVDYEVVAKRD